MGATTDKIKGTANEAIGKAKQGIGEATGSDRLQGEGVIQELKGKGRRQRCWAKGRNERSGSRSEQKSLIAQLAKEKARSLGAGHFVLSRSPSPRRRVKMRQAFIPPVGGYFTASSSTSNISVAFGGITPPAPRAP